jgi:PTS system galactitol-specific IIA component
MLSTNEKALDTSHVLLDANASSWTEAIREACAILERCGDVKAGYADDVIERERSYPTGLPSVPYGVAIPHALVFDNVNSPHIGAMRLTNPVAFRQCGSNDDEMVDVSFLFVLALNDAQAQLSTLQRLMSVFSNQETLQALMHAGSNEEFVQEFNQGALVC